MRKIYKTKKRKAEFAQIYHEIGTINRYISEYEIEIKTHLKYGNFTEAISKQETINEMKIKLLKFAEQGWDIEYYLDSISGLEVIATSAELS